MRENINRFLYSLYNDVSAVQTSIECRKRHSLIEDRSLIYGDSHLPSLHEILDEVKPKVGEVFYDLGSGGGRTVLLAALGFPFAKSIGIELLDDLVVLSQKKLELLKQTLPNLSNFDATKLGEIKFMQADCLTANISGANIIYIASTCFSDGMMQKLAQSLEKQLAIGTRVITFTKPLPAKKFKIVKRTLYPMEWGQTTTFFHEKY